MLARRGLRRAGALLAFSSLVIVACDSETIELLPADAGSPAVAGGAGIGTGNVPTAGGNPPGDPATGGTVSTTGGGAGEAGTVACAGAECGGSHSGGSGGFGGSPWTGGCDPEFRNCDRCETDQQCPRDWHCAEQLGGFCVECFDDDDCRPEQRCAFRIGQCRPSCEDSINCADGNVCDPEQRICVECASHSDCDSKQGTPYCAWPEHVCVQCLGPDHCKNDAQSICAAGRCTE